MVVERPDPPLHSASPRVGWRPVTLIALTALWMVAAHNCSFWQGLAKALANEAHARSLLTGMGVVMWAYYLMCLILIGWWRLLKPLLCLILLFSASTAYFMDTFGVTIDGDMVRNLFETNTGEAREYLSWDLLWRIGVLGLMPAALVAVAPLKHLGLRRAFAERGVLFLAALSVLGMTAALEYKNLSFVAREHIQLRRLLNPYYPLGSFWYYAKHRSPPKVLAQSPLGHDARRAPAAPGLPLRLVVLVLGETARAQNFGLYGYERPTTPRLLALPLVQLGPAQSCGTATAQSVPCMFSLLGRSRFSSHPRLRYWNVLEVLAHAGVPTLWLDNDSGCKEICGAASFVDVARSAAPDHCLEQECWDEVLLAPLQQALAATTADRLIVVHHRGSHGPAYYRRYPPEFRRFQPECRRLDVQNCSTEEIVNAYDNSIAYTDEQLGEMVERIEQHTGAAATAMIYLSDHGESLGENGVYLHGLPYAIAPATQTTVPFVLWLSPQWRAAEGLDQGCLTSRPAVQGSHDQLAHLLLGLFRVRTQAYRPALDPLAACRPPLRAG